MATFSFEPALLNHFTSEERGVLLSHGRAADGKFYISQQQKYRITSEDVSYTCTLVRKVQHKSIPAPVLTRRKNVLLKERQLDKNGFPVPEKQGVNNRGFETSAFEVKRLTYKVEIITKVVDLTSQPTLDSTIKHGRFNWIVTDIKATPQGNPQVEIKEGDKIFKGEIYGDKIVTKVTELPLQVNKLIYRLCFLKNRGSACISGQRHQTVKSLHARKEPNQIQAISQAQFAADSGKLRRNKLAEITPLMRGDYSEHIVYDDKGKFVSRELSVAANNSSFAFTKSPAKEFVTVDLGVSEQYKPISMPTSYKECDTFDKSDSPVLVDLSAAEKKLRAMGFL